MIPNIIEVRNTFIAEHLNDLLPQEITLGNYLVLPNYTLSFSV